MLRFVMTSICAAGLVLGVAACDRQAEYGGARDQQAQDQAYGERQGELQNEQDVARDQTMRDRDGGIGTAGDAAVDVADIVGNPNRYFGQTVTVEADLEEVFGPRAFALDEDAPLRGGVDRDLLVFGKATGNLERIDDQWMNNRVRVTGTIGRFSVVELEREVGWDLDPQIEVELERAGAVMVAESVTRVNQNNR